MLLVKKGIIQQLTVKEFVRGWRVRIQICDQDIEEAIENGNQSEKLACKEGIRKIDGGQVC